MMSSWCHCYAGVLMERGRTGTSAKDRLGSRWKSVHHLPCECSHTLCLSKAQRVRVQEAGRKPARWVALFCGHLTSRTLAGWLKLRSLYQAAARKSLVRHPWIHNASDPALWAASDADTGFCLHDSCRNPHFGERSARVSIQRVSACVRRPHGSWQSRCPARQRNPDPCHKSRAATALVDSVPPPSSIWSCAPSSTRGAQSIIGELTCSRLDA